MNTFENKVKAIIETGKSEQQAREIVNSMVKKEKKAKLKQRMRIIQAKIKKAELTDIVKQHKKKQKNKDKLIHTASKDDVNQKIKNRKIKKINVKGKMAKDERTFGQFIEEDMRSDSIPYRKKHRKPKNNQLEALKKKIYDIKNPQGPSGGTAETAEDIIKDAEAVAKPPTYIAKEHDHNISFKAYRGYAYKRANLISNTGKYAKYWLLNAKQTNGNGWGVSQQSIAKNIYKFIGRPLVVTAKSWIANSEYGDAYEHPYLPTNDINKVFEHQEKFRVGSIIDIIEKDGDYFANVELNQKFAHMILPPFCSPAIFQNNTSEPEGQISDWEALHLAALNEDPAYGSRIALLRGTCMGTQDQCTIQFKSAKQEAKMICTNKLRERISTLTAAQRQTKERLGKLKKNNLKQKLSRGGPTTTNNPFGKNEGDHPDASIGMYRQNIGPGSINTQPNIEVKRQKSMRGVDGGIPKPRWMKTRENYQGNYKRPLPEFEKKIPSNRGINYTGETRDDKFKKIIVPRTKEDIEAFKGQNWREGETRKELETQGMYDKERFRTRYKDIKKNIPASMVENTAPKIPGSVDIPYRNLYSVDGHPKGMSEAAFKRELQTDYKDHRVGVNKNKIKSKAEKMINKELKDLTKEYTSVRIDRREYNRRYKDLINKLDREEALRKGDTRGYRDNKSPFHEPIKAIKGEYDYEVENIADEEDIISSGAYDEEVTESFQDQSFSSIKGDFENGTRSDEDLSKEFTSADRTKALDSALESAANYIPNANNMSRTELMELLEYIFDNDIESFSDPAVMSISRQNAQRWSKLKQRLAAIRLARDDWDKKEDETEGKKSGVSPRKDTYTGNPGFSKKERLEKMKEYEKFMKENPNATHEILDDNLIYTPEDIVRFDEELASGIPQSRVEGFSKFPLSSSSANSSTKYDVMETGKGLGIGRGKSVLSNILEDKRVDETLIKKRGEPESFGEMFTRKYSHMQGENKPFENDPGKELKIGDYSQAVISRPNAIKYSKHKQRVAKLKQRLASPIIQETGEGINFKYIKPKQPLEGRTYGYHKIPMHPSNTILIRPKNSEHQKQLIKHFRQIQNKELGKFTQGSVQSFIPLKHVKNLSSPFGGKISDHTTVSQGINKELKKGDILMRRVGGDPSKGKMYGQVGDTFYITKDSPKGELFKYESKHKKHGSTYDMGKNPAFAKLKYRIANISKIESITKMNPEHGKIIADSYDKMLHDPKNPAVKKSYDALITETESQFNELKKNGLRIDPIKQGTNPYKTSNDLYSDLKKNNHLYYYPSEQGFGSDNKFNDHPLLKNSGVTYKGKKLPANDLFRIVHDINGHNLANSDFTLEGEHNAYLSHRKMYSPLAGKALFTETAGQSNWGGYNKKSGASNMKLIAEGRYNDLVFADQKAGLFPDHIINTEWHTPHASRTSKLKQRLAYIGATKYDKQLTNLQKDFEGMRPEILKRRHGTGMGKYDLPSHNEFGNLCTDEATCGATSTSLFKKLGLVEGETNVGFKNVKIEGGVYSGPGSEYSSAAVDVTDYKKRKKGEPLSGAVGHVWIKLEDGTIVDGSAGQFMNQDAGLEGGKYKGREHRQKQRLRIIRPTDPLYKHYKGKFELEKFTGKKKWYNPKDPMKKQVDKYEKNKLSKLKQRLAYITKNKRNIKKVNNKVDMKTTFDLFNEQYDPVVHDVTGGTFDPKKGRFVTKEELRNDHGIKGLNLHVISSSNNVTGNTDGMVDDYNKLSENNRFIGVWSKEGKRYIDSSYILNTNDKNEVIAELVKHHQRESYTIDSDGNVSSIKNPHHTSNAI